MPGIGSGPFGSDPFGVYGWARQVLYRDWPVIDRRLDTEEAGGLLEKWTKSMSPLFEEVLLLTRDFEQLRDPDSVRTQYQDNLSITITSSAVETANRTVRVEVVDPDPNDPLVPLGRTSVGWVLKDADGREFFVNEVHKLSAAFTVASGGNILPVAGAATLRPQAQIGFLGKDYGLTIDQHDAEVFQRCFARNAFQWLSLKGIQRSYEIIGKVAGYDVVAYRLWSLPDPPPSFIPSSNLYEVPDGSGVWYTDLDARMPLFDEVVADVVPTDVICWDDYTSGMTYGELIGSAMQSLAVTGTSYDAVTGQWTITIGLETGTGDEFVSVAGDGTVTFEDLGATFTSSMVGRKMTFVGATTPANDGEFEISAYLSSTQIQFINPLAVAEVFGGTWSIDPSLDSFVANAGFVNENEISGWYATFPGGDSGNFQLEDDPVDLGGGSWEVVVTGASTLTVGFTVSIDYECPITVNCWYCPASAIRVTIVPNEVLNEPESLLDDALERMVRKIRKVVPLHVRLVQLTHIVGPVTAAIQVDQTPGPGHIYFDVTSQQVAVFAYASIGYYFDIVEADEIEVDPGHISIEQVTQFDIGTGDTIGGAAPSMTLTDADGGFTSDMVGKNIIIAGATTGTNDGTFPIASYTSPTLIGYTNAVGTAEAFPGTWTVQV